MFQKIKRDTKMDIRLVSPVHAYPAPNSSITTQSITEPLLQRCDRGAIQIDFPAANTFHLN